MASIRQHGYLFSSQQNLLKKSEFLVGLQMRSGRWKIQSTRSTLEVLKNRLEEACYDEDRTETLQKISTYALSHPAEVLEICLDAIVKSIEVTEDKALQSIILHSLFTSSYGEDMISRIIGNSPASATYNNEGVTDNKNYSPASATDNKNYSKIFLENTVDFLATSIRTISSVKFYRFLAKNDEITKMSIKLLGDGYFREFCLLVRCNSSLKEILAFEGVFEELSKAYAAEKRKVAAHPTENATGHPAENVHFSEPKSAILALLTESPKNQQYFIESDLFTNFIVDDLEIAQLLLNPEAKFYHSHQEKLLKPLLMTRALENKAYGLIHSLIASNEKNFEIFIEKYLKLETLIDDCLMDIEALEIIELVMKFTYLPVQHPSSFRINILLCIHSMSFSDLDYLLVEDIKEKRAGIDALIYLVFTRNSIDDLLPYLSHLSYFESPLLNSMCLLIHLLFNIPVDLDPFQISIKLKYLRRYLLEKKVATDTVNESIISTIDQYIPQFTSTFEKKEYVNYNRPDEPSSPSKDMSPERSSAIIEGVNSKVRDFFSKFTRREPEKKKYDL